MIKIYHSITTNLSISDHFRTGQLKIRDCEHGNKCEFFSEALLWPAFAPAQDHRADC